MGQGQTNAEEPAIPDGQPAAYWDGGTRRGRLEGVESREVVQEAGGLVEGPRGRVRPYCLSVRPALGSVRDQFEQVFADVWPLVGEHAEVDRVAAGAVGSLSVATQGSLGDEPAASERV